MKIFIRFSLEGFKFFLTVVIFFLQTPGFVSATLTCDDGWVFDGQQRCYKFVVDDWYTYQEALQQCNQYGPLGGVLASVTDIETYDFIFKELNNIWTAGGYCSIWSCGIDYDCDNRPCVNLWIGLERPEHVDSTDPRDGWKWLDGSPYYPEATRWAKDEPLYFTTFTKLGPMNNSHDLFIGNVPTEEIQLGFICSKEAATVATRNTTTPTFTLANTLPTSSASTAGYTVTQPSFDISNYQDTTPLPNSQTVAGYWIATGLAIGILIGCVIVCVIGTIIFAVYIKRSSRNRDTTTNGSISVISDSKPNITQHSAVVCISDKLELTAESYQA